MQTIVFITVYTGVGLNTTTSSAQSDAALTRLAIEEAGDLKLSAALRAIQSNRPRRALRFKRGEQSGRREPTRRVGLESESESSGQHRPRDEPVAEKITDEYRQPDADGGRSGDEDDVLGADA